MPDLYSALVNSIVGQQISAKAKATIWQRMQERFTPFSPATLGSVPIEELQACGISMRKAIYIQEMTQAVLKVAFISFPPHSLPKVLFTYFLFDTILQYPAIIGVDCLIDIQDCAADCHTVKPN